MAPDSEKEELSMTGEEIVISGISGQFPNTENTKELIHNLYNKVDMISKIENTSIKHPEVPSHFGKISDCNKFDGQFFRIYGSQTNYIEAAARKIMEQAYSAIFDAGINPGVIKGTRVGVFMGSYLADASSDAMHNIMKFSTHVISGNNKSMIANRISYWVDGKGPSFNIDCACASFMACLETAYHKMKTGECDSAIIGSCSHSTHPVLAINHKRAGNLCMDGKTKCFDVNGDGFVKSDAVNVFFLQKAKDAKRIYAEVCYVKGKYFAKPDSLFLPTRNPEDIVKFLEEFYSELNISPNEVEFVEANATGISEADGNELEALGEVFGQDKPLKVGSIKSNLGHTFAASGACSLTKLMEAIEVLSLPGDQHLDGVIRECGHSSFFGASEIMDKVCLAYQRGEIPPNLYYNNPQNNVVAVREGKVQVVTENTLFGRGYTAINNFSNTGANFHVLLKGHYIPKKHMQKTTLPYLILASGREENSVNQVLDILEESPIDVEQIALLHNIFKQNIEGHTGRGFTVIDTNEDGKTVSLAKGFEYHPGTYRPVWFLYSGMGSQWPTMGKELMRIPIFAAAIERCDKALRPKGVNISKIITDSDKSIFDNITHSFVGITAIQIALTDVIKSMGISPDNIIGHSAGEIACAYADGCFTIEETILVSYYRAKVVTETEFIKGKMAAVGLGQTDLRKICPPEIAIVCHNSSESTTIAGPAEKVDNFIEYLTSQSIFAKVVASNDVAFHSKYIKNAEPKLLAYMKQVIKNPKERSHKWLSTCFLPGDWENPNSLHASPKYFTRNMMGVVNFEETATMIPDDAIIIEIAPHALFQAIMKRSHTSCINIGLTKRGDKDSVLFLLKAVGTLYQAGLSPDVSALYPVVRFPVSTEASVLTHFVGWDHRTDWLDPCDYIVEQKIMSQSYELNLSVHDDDYIFIQGCIRNGVNIFPEAAILVAVWQTLGMINKMDYKKMSVAFENVHFHNEIKIELEKKIALLVSIQRASNVFEVTQDETIIAQGSIKNKSTKKRITFPKPDKIFTDSDEHLNKDNVYKTMQARGYSYSGIFQSIQASNIGRNKSLLTWDDNWTTFLDSMFQFNSLSRDHDGVSSVKLITKLSIDVFEHEEYKIVKNNAIYYSAFLSNNLSRSGGVTLNSLVFTDKPKLEEAIDSLFTRSSLSKHEGRQAYVPVEVKTTTQNVKLVHDNNKLTRTEMSIPSKNVVKICYSNASLSNNPEINKNGTDFSGVDTHGNKVMGIIPQNSISSIAEADLELLWPVPEFWTLEEAATVPLPYIQAYYCLKIRLTLREKDTVFIGNGDSGLGQAAIAICIGHNCTVFTTVDSMDSKRFLLRLFPELNEDHIGYSNDIHFQSMIQTATKGNGLDVAVSFSSGKIREAILYCIGPSGKHLDVCENGMWNNENFYMGNLTNGRNFVTICLSSIHMKENILQRKALQKMLFNGIVKGFVKPLPRVVYFPNEISRAFKLLASRNYTGRVVVNMNPSANNVDINALPRLSLSPDEVYIVVYDGSDLGIELIDHLVKRGGRKFLLNLKPKLMNGFFHLKFALWKKQDVNITFNADDLHIEIGCDSLIKQGTKLGNIEGIFIAYNDISDASKTVILETDVKDYATMTINLDLASRKIYTLRFFAILSQNVRNETTFASIEKYCFDRKDIGLPALVIRYEEQNSKFSTISISKLFGSLDAGLLLNHTSALSSYDIENTQMSSRSSTVDNGFEELFGLIIDEVSISTDPVILMKTKLQNAAENDICLDPDNAYLLMIPGFDGNYLAMNAVSERLKIMALSLQLEPEFTKSLPEIAARLLEITKMRVHLKPKFYIFGYSFGVDVALELAALLEREGKTGVVLCLDSSPDALKMQLNTHLGNMTKQEQQTFIINHIYKLLTGQTSSELNKKLKNIFEFTDKIDEFIKFVKTSVSLSVMFLRSAIQTVYARISLAMEYKPEFILESEIVLMRGSSRPSTLRDDYGLSKYSKRPVKVFDIKADHANALQDCRVSNIINKMLDPKLLENFNNMNLCHSYYHR